MSQVLREKLATNLRQYREGKSMKREELSLRLGVDNSYISKLERKAINITIDKIEKIANILEIEPTLLLK